LSEVNLYTAAHYKQKVVSAPLRTLAEQKYLLKYLLAGQSKR